MGIHLVNVNAKYLCVGPSRIHLLCGHDKCRMVIDELLFINSHEKTLQKIILWIIMASLVALDVGN